MQPNNLDSLLYPLRDDVKKLSEAGYVTLAREQISYLLHNDKVDGFEAERLRLEDHLLSLRFQDFPYDESSALVLLKTVKPEADKDDLEQLRLQGIVPFSLYDGTIHYHRRFLDTLQKANDTPQRKADLALREEMIRRLKRNGKVETDITVHIGLSLDEADTTDKTVNADLPVPVSCPFIKDVRILRQSGQMIGIDGQNMKRRTAHFRGKMAPGEEFWIEYSFTNSMVYNKMDVFETRAKPSVYHAKDEAPYLVRTPYLAALAKEIIGDERNPVKMAKCIYQYITKNVSYAYMPSYQSIDNLAEYGALMRRGDCGIQAALFINLCRLCGIKAGWMGGMYVRPGEIANHDWAVFSIPDLPDAYADCSFGGGALLRGDEEGWNHYFGNLDPMRLPCTLALASKKESSRPVWLNDPTDNQSGEAWYDDSPISREKVLQKRITMKFDMHD